MIIGHERQMEYLQRVVMRKKLAHAYLFWGPEHVGKLTIAKRLTQALYCEQAAGSFEKICGSCRECHAIDALAHQDLVYLDLEHTLT